VGVYFKKKKEEKEIISNIISKDFDFKVN
jgi:hypothetical protein